MSDCCSFYVTMRMSLSDCLPLFAVLTRWSQRALADLGLAPADSVRSRPWPTALAATPATPVASADMSSARPIFWANRAAHRSPVVANEFPNGRWTLSSSPAFGELSDYYLAAKRPLLDRRAMWGAPRSIADVVRVFVSFLEGTVQQLPWCDASPALETHHISYPLRWMNTAGFLTINSQPRVNGISSSDDRFGWGGPDGVVFQKAYIECWVSPESFERLLAALPRFPSLGVHAINVRGEERLNVPADRACAVTWGVWPGREIIQPTVVDPRSFRLWAQEAFELWRSQWMSACQGDGDVEARRLIQSIHDSYWLVNVVDNEFVDPAADIFAIFREVVIDALPVAELRSQLLRLEADNASLRAELVSMQDEKGAREAELLRAQVAQRAAEAEARALRRQLIDVERWRESRLGSSGADSAAFTSEGRGLVA
jgi:methylenetetrahydrofolate reductase (NADPH)